MTIKNIITEPNKILRQTSLPVESVGKEEQRLMNDMLDTMYSAKGIGLAAIQIGVPKRIIVLDISKDEKKKNPLYFVNPVIKNKNSSLSTYEEGCLSVPNQFAEIDRPSTCEVYYLDYIFFGIRRYLLRMHRTLSTETLATTTRRFCIWIGYLKMRSKYFFFPIHSCSKYKHDTH